MTQRHPRMRLVGALLVVCAAATSLQAGRRADNTLYIEYGGAAGLYSLNFDRMFYHVGRTQSVGIRAGVSWLPLSTHGDIAFFSIPFSLVHFLGKSEHKLETDLGFTTRVTVGGGRTQVLANLSPSIGYRFQMYESDFNFRLMFTPLFFGRFVPWLGLSLGRSF